MRYACQMNQYVSSHVEIRLERENGQLLVHHCLIRTTLPNIWSEYLFCLCVCTPLLCNAETKLKFLCMLLHVRCSGLTPVNNGNTHENCCSILSMTTVMDLGGSTPLPHRQGGRPSMNSRYNLVCLTASTILNAHLPYSRCCILWPANFCFDKLCQVAYPWASLRMLFPTGGPKCSWKGCNHGTGICTTMKYYHVPLTSQSSLQLPVLYMSIFMV